MGQVRPEQVSKDRAAVQKERNAARNRGAGASFLKAKTRTTSLQTRGR